MPRLPRRHLLLLFMAVPLTCGLMALALGMDANWDLRNYHYYNAYAFLTGRFGWDVLVAQIPSFYNPTLDAPYYLLEQALPARLLGFLLGSLHGLNFILLFFVARNLLRNEFAAVALALAGILGGGAVSEIGTTFYDNFASLGVFGSLLIVVTRWEVMMAAPPRRAALNALVAGIPVGLAFGLKQPSVIYAVGLCFAFLLGLDRPRRRLFLSFVFGLGVLAGLSITAGHWMLFLWKSYGNPLFPYFNHIFQSPWGLPLPYRDTQYLDHNTGLKRLLFPFTFTFNSRAAGEVDMFDARVLAAFLLVLVAVPAFLLRRRVGPRLSMHGSTGYVLGAATLSYAVWLALFGIYRYLIPLEMLAPLLVVLAAGLLPLSLRVRAGLAAAIVAMLVLTAYPGNWLRVDWERKAVTATVPTIEQADRTMVLMAGHEPLSFLIPSFPPAMRFVRIDSTFSNPEESGVRFNELMRRMVGEHQGPLTTLYIPTEEHDVVKRLADYGLTLDKDSCQPVTSPIGAAPYAYCRVVRNRS